MPDRQRLSRPARILIASDQNAGLREFESFLGRHGYVVLRLYAGTPVLERARAVPHDVIILDEKLADRESLELSRTLRDDPAVGLSTPILLLVRGSRTAGDHLVALRAGIWEFLTQPLDPNELLLRLDTLVRAKFEADRASKEQLVDEVTGLYSAQGLARRARELIFQAAQHNTSAACVVFAPEFAGEPEAAGPGSEAIERTGRVARVLRAAGRRSDAIGRVGATEFAVFAPGTDAGGAVKLAERFRRAVPPGGTAEPGARPAFELRAGYDAVGNVRYTPVDANDLLARAARALQLARAGGTWIQRSSEGPRS